MTDPPPAPSAIPAETLLSFVPQLIASQIVERPDPLAAAATDVTASVLQCDLRGFTALTEKLAQRGPQGVEELSRALSWLFGQLTKIVAEHGGDVVMFAGDALIVSWPIGDSASARAAVRRAAQCGLALQELLRTDSVAREHDMAMRAGVGLGDYSALQLGGVRDRWTVAVVGDVLGQLAAAETASEAGQVTLSPEAWASLGEPAASERRNRPTAIDADAFDPIEPVILAPLDVPPVAADLLWSFIPSAARARLASGQQHWIGELRRLSVMFVDMPDLTAAPSIESAQAMFTELQTVLYRFEGSLDKLSVDEKGAKAICAFGLPPVSHEDDPMRAVLAAREIQRHFAELGWRCSIGVTTGRAFCGIVGGDSRREYTLHGDVVNLGARLMQAADGGVLTDEATYLDTQHRIAFRASRPIAIKGKSEPVTAYSPTGEHEAGISAVLSTRGPSTGLVGRQTEAERLERLLDQLGEGRGEVVLLEGEAGIGKSRLVDHLITQASTRQMRVLAGAGDPIESGRAYRVWSPILTDYFGLDSLPADREVRRNHVLSAIGDGDEARLAPLLNSILALDIADNELTAGMDADVRADNLQVLVSTLLQTAADERPLVLVLDDAHWMDSGSWLLARHVFQSVRPLAVIVATRPVEEPLPPEYRAFMSVATPDRIVLGPLPDSDISSLVCDTLGVESLPDPIIELLRDKAEGHPFFSKELAYYLRNEGLIVTEPAPQSSGKPLGRLVEGADLSDIAFPETVQVVVTSRIDRLEPAQQLILKVASVIGRDFRASVLEGVLPAEAQPPHLEAELKRMAESELISLQAPDPDPIYEFTHGIIQEVAYSLLLFAQRRELHAAVAAWFEQMPDEEREQFVPLLAHHWTMAEDPDRAVHYLGLAGEQALAGFANEEAIDAFKQALDLASRSEATIDPLTQARWELQMGEAQVHWSRYGEGRRHLERGLDLLDHPVPESTSSLGRAANVAKALVRQLRFRLVAPRSLVEDAHDRARLLLASRSYTRLVEAAFLEGEQWLALYSSFHALNLAERAAPSSELAEAYMPIGVIYATIPWRSEAERYLDRALETARSAGTPGALGFVLLGNGTYRVGKGDWAAAEAMADELVDLGRHFGIRRRVGDGLYLATILAYARNRFDRCVELANQLMASAAESHDPRLMALGHFARAQGEVHLGRPDVAMEHLERIPVLSGAEAETLDRSLEMQYFALVGLAQLQLGDPSGAYEAATNALARQAGATLDLGYVHPGYTVTADVLLRLSQDGFSHADLASDTRRAVVALKKFARTYPIASPDAHLGRGHLALLAGKQRSAARHFRHAVDLGRQLDMPLKAGRALLGLAALDPAERPQQLQAARELFETSGALDDLRQVDEGPGAS